MPQLRKYNQWILTPPFDPDNPGETVSESASFPLLLELLGRHSEITSFGKAWLTGTQATKNLRWYHYRNLMRQAIGNFRAALEVPNRSACLLYYYSMLNFAKAELLDANYATITGRLHHGLSFNPTKAKTVAGDNLRVLDGAFKLLYERRTGRTLPIGTMLPVKRLLANIPEIGQQVSDASLGNTNIPGGILHMVATNGSESWTVLAIVNTDLTRLGAATKNRLEASFEPVDPTPDVMGTLRENFGVSRRNAEPALIYQSRRTVTNSALTPIDFEEAMKLTWEIKDILGLRTTEQYDAFLSPSLYKQRMLVMPPSLSRYAITFYASSLVRYRPYMFDAERYPEQAYMFDAIARECAQPMLIDTLAGLEGQPYYFNASNSMRA